MGEIRVIKIQKARKMKYNNAEGVTIMKLPKTGKKNPKCNNWRGITLILTFSRMFNRVLLDRVKLHVNG